MRIVAFLVLLLAILYVVSGNWVVIVLLVIDFLLRTLYLNAYSPLSILSGEIVKLLKLENRPVDRAPKRFAALAGFIFSTATLLTLLLQLTITSKIIAGILIAFASLESFIGFCAGCYVYSLLKQFNVLK